MNLMLEAWESSVMMLDLGKSLKMVCTPTMVLQSASVSSSAELDVSLLTTTTFSVALMPALSRSSRLKRKERER